MLVTSRVTYSTTDLDNSLGRRLLYIQDGV